MPKHDPVLSAPSSAPALNLGGGTTLARRITSKQTHGEFAVVEFISDPGGGVGLHVHQHEDEFVYLIDGEIEVTLGDQTMIVPRGACALLPRGIPHGYINRGREQSRLLAVLMPGRLDEFFIELDAELAADRPHDEHIGALCERFGLEFQAPTGD